MDEVLVLLIEFCTVDEIALFESAWDSEGELDEDYIKENLTPQRALEIASYMLRERNQLGDGEPTDKGANLYSALVGYYVITNKINITCTEDIELIMIK